MKQTIIATRETGKWMEKYVTDTILMKKRTSQIGFTA